MDGAGKNNFEQIKNVLLERGLIGPGSATSF
jgi:hypothetical protein